MAGAADMIVEVCRRMAARGFVAATDGNVSARLPNGNILTTRTSVHKGAVTAADLVEVTPAGDPAGSAVRPSTEIGMHLFIYSRRPDASAVVHAHPPYATGFAAAGLALDRCVFPEVVVGLGSVPLASYATPSTDEVAASLEPFLERSDAILLANHGVVAFGSDPWDAYFKLEKVEHAAHITLIARLLGGERTLTAEQLARLGEVSPAAYGREIAGGCSVDPNGSPDRPAPGAAPLPLPGEEEIRQLVRRMIRGE